MSRRSVTVALQEKNFRDDSRQLETVGMLEIVAKGWRERIVGLVEERMLEVFFGGGVVM